MGICVAYGINLSLLEMLVSNDDLSNDWAESIFITLLIVLFIVFGVLAVKLQRPMLIIGTAVIGALYISATLQWLLELLDVSVETTNITTVCVLIVLVVAGTIVQFKVTAAKYHHHHHGHH